MDNSDNLLHDAELALTEGNRNRAILLLVNAIEIDFSDERVWQRLHSLLAPT